MLVKPLEKDTYSQATKTQNGGQNAIYSGKNIKPVNLDC
jgi:hypothetical protein